MFLYKNKNGKWYIIYTTASGRRSSKSTGQKLKGEAHKFLTEFKRKSKRKKSSC